MHAIAKGSVLTSRSKKNAKALFNQALDVTHQHTDRLFAYLLMIEWVVGIAAALVISPRTWIGATSQVHVHVWAAILLGGTIAIFPAALALLQPGRVLTRHTIAIAQMLFSALLIHLSGGRIETHFHIFGSLAFLAFYRDWKVLVSATLVVVLDHILRGIFWPQSIFGVLTASHWRWMEHSGWVVFEDTFLFISIRQGLREMREVAMRRATLEGSHAEVERQVVERTAELVGAQRELLETSRRAGMAEVATSVLHNVGNVLNSVNVASSRVSETVKKSKAATLERVVVMMREHESDLGDYLTNDPKGKQLPGYLEQLAKYTASEQAGILAELAGLQKNIEHIKDIVTMQQSFAKVSGVTETVPVGELVEDALRMNASGLARHDIHVSKEFDEVPPLTIEKNRVLQILVNLVQNAKHACDSSGRPDKLVSFRVRQKGDRVRIGVSDNGVGISRENLARIFSHGFTTKDDGHGFGLHSGALAAKELGGSLTVHSKGLGQGADFVLELPYKAA